MMLGRSRGIVPDEDGSADARSVAQEALDLYGQARERLREGDLAGYDSIQREIEELLRSAVAEE